MREDGGSLQRRRERGGKKLMKDAEKECPAGGGAAGEEKRSPGANRIVGGDGGCAPKSGDSLKSNQPGGGELWGLEERGKHVAAPPRPVSEDHTCYCSPRPLWQCLVCFFFFFFRDLGNVLDRACSRGIKKSATGRNQERKKRRRKKKRRQHNLKMGKR